MNAKYTLTKTSFPAITADPNTWHQVGDADGNTVAMVKNEDAAHTLAVAPELLEALEFAMQDADSQHGQLDFDTVEIIREAIAKAKGEIA